MTGRAIIRVAGAVYLAEHCQLAGATVTFTGRRRIRDLSGERLYAPRTITIPAGRVDRIEWLADEQTATRLAAVA